MTEYYKNPFNYTGAKYKLLPQILPLFPAHIDTFFDVFGGSAEVSLNINAERVLYNDKCEPLVNILRNLDGNFVEEVENAISKFNLGKTNKEEFLACRKYFNDNRDKLSDRERAVLLYCLLTHAFNYQIAFNSKGEYNMPSGYNRSWFSPQLKSKLEKYIKRIKEIDIEFKSEDITEFSYSYTFFDRNIFFYIDPPYLITTGAYERDYFCKWSEEYEKYLLRTLSNLDDKGYKFALSNVLSHKGKVNEILTEWSKNYNVHHLNIDYKNCNYQTNARENKESDEVLITNY